MKIYLATWLTDRFHGEELTKKRYRNRLLSYYFLCEQRIKAGMFQQYIRTGRLDTRKHKDK